MKYLQQQPSNIKSVSDHMTGYSNNFSNTSNLQTENLRLQNNLLDKYPMLKNEANNNNNNNNNNESRFKTIEDGNNKNNEYISYILKSAYGGEFSYRPMTKYTSLRSQPLIEEPPEKDNIDVAATAGSEGFKTLNNDKNDDDDDIDTNIPNTPQLGIRPPQGVDNNNEDEDEDENLNDNTFNEVDSTNEGELEEDSVEGDSEEESEEDSEEEPVKESVAKPVAKPVAAPQTRSQANPQSKRKSQPLPKEETLFELKAYYTQLGGDNNDILTSDKVLPIRVAIATLIREAKAEARKNKNKKK